MAMKFLLKVEDVFDISGRGWVIAPAIPDDLKVKVGIKDQIRLRTPDERILETHIASFSFGRPVGGGRCLMNIELPRDLAKQDVPIGTEVWLL
jgi:hypothetical protein